MEAVPASIDTAPATRAGLPVLMLRGALTVPFRTELHNPGARGDGDRPTMTLSRL